jgi:hypothetical protein
MRHRSPLRFGPGLLPAAAIALSALLAVPAGAQQANIAGSWNGSGTVRLPSGNTENVRCRATFNQSGSSATMSATCASPSTRVYQTADLTRVGGNRFSGDFVNREFGVSGSIKITINGNSMSAALAGGGGSAFLNLSR